jgi:oligogalacturonide lyase
MIGKQYAGEKHTYRDEKTGREVTQLTSGSANNYHMYFTDNSFSLGDKEIYFMSDRGSSQPLLFNLFHMDLASGRMTQLTDEPLGLSYATKTPDSEHLVYTSGKTIRRLDTKTGEIRTIYEGDAATSVGHPFISSDKKYIGFARNEDVKIARGANYMGFKESMFAIKKAWITFAALDGSKSFDVWEDTHWLGHFQFSPDDSNVAMFCHEGPWNLVHQRIWLLDVQAQSVQPCFRQEEDDCVGHEFWTRDGYLFFDNRRKGHDGTITSHGTQATAPDPASDQIPYIGFADKRGELLKTIEMPFYCNHYHANIDNTLLVGDEVDDLVLIHLDRENARLETLCTHKTSWHTQQVHCHPTFSWDNRHVLFTSDREGQGNIYMINVEQ